ncbi:O-antigen ligase family protein [Thalassospira sp. NFXS8]|uniref:O-antigen ligase family protein n=1 Tax=Thalassospira sp. NFXS8 TaxID=2819093 RepID=UPI0032DFFDAD
MTTSRIYHLHVIIVFGIFLNFSLFKFGQGHVGTAYVFSALFFLFFPISFGKEMLIPVVFFVITFLSSLISTFEFGFNYKMMTCANIIIGSALGVTLSKFYYNKLGDFFSKVCYLLLAANLIRDFFYIFNGHTSYNVYDFFFVTNGGPNIEISILAMASLLTRDFYARFSLIIYVLLKSSLYDSRAGLIIAFLSAFFYFRDMLKIKTFYIVVIYLFMLAVVFLGLFFETITYTFLDQFFKFDLEWSYLMQEQGRLFLWSSGWDIFKNNLLGVGVGNGIRNLESAYHFSVVENNFHNIYIQYLVEGSFLSVFVFLIFARRVIFTVFTRDVFRKSTYGAATAMLISGLFQWTGYGIFEWLIFGLFLGQVSMVEGESRELMEDG